VKKGAGVPPEDRGLLRFGPVGAARNWGDSGPRVLRRPRLRRATRGYIPSPRWGECEDIGREGSGGDMGRVGGSDIRQDAGRYRRRQVRRDMPRMHGPGGGRGM